MTVSEQQHWRRAKEIFEAACDAPAALQRQVVEDLAGGDAALAAGVWRLLALQDHPSLTLDFSAILPFDPDARWVDAMTK